MKKKTTAIIVIVLGSLLVLCVGPLAVNSLVFVTSSLLRPTPYSLYGHLFPARVGTINLASYVSAAQLALATLLAVLVVVAGIVVARAKQQ